MRLSGQPCCSAASIIGSSLRCSRTTPPTTSRKNAASAGRYWSPSTSRPIQWLSNSARISLSAGAGDIHLIERLHGGEPRRAAAVGLAIVCCSRACGQDAFRRRLSATSASAARAASPPLSPPPDARARPGLRLVVDGEDAVADRHAARATEISISRARRFASTRSRNGWSRRGSRSRAQPRRRRASRPARRHRARS